jgi:hypothetical protein
MGIFQATYKPSGAGVVTIVVAQEKVDDPTARIVIYAPLGYKATLTQAPGRKSGMSSPTSRFSTSAQTRCRCPARSRRQPGELPCGVEPLHPWGYT